MKCHIRNTCINENKALTRTCWPVSIWTKLDRGNSFGMTSQSVLQYIVWLLDASIEMLVRLTSKYKFTPCHRTYKQSEYRKILICLMVLHPTFQLCVAHVTVLCLPNLFFLWLGIKQYCYTMLSCSISCIIKNCIIR